MKRQFNDQSAIEMAYFRFALIAPVIQGIFTDPSKTAYYRRVTENELNLPNGRTVRYNPKTLEKWEMKGLASFIIKLDASIYSVNQTTEYFSYDYDTVWQGFSNRYFGDNENVNLPRENLPFYSILEKFEPQEYGTYR